MTSDAMALVATAIEAATAYERPDLVTRLEEARGSLDRSRVRVMVVGEFKQGKSSLVNAMVNAPVCPVDDDVATAVPTVVRYAPSPVAGAVRGRGSDRTTEPIKIAEVASYACEQGNPSNERALVAVEIGLPRRVLSDGLELVDTPGVGGLGSAHAAATIAALPAADLILFVSDASQELTQTELEFLAEAQELCPTTAFVQTKTDFYPDWHQIRDLNIGHLRALPHPVAVFPASATLRRKAIESQDKAINIESGYLDLMQFVASTRSRLAATVTSSVANELRSVIDQLRAPFEGERQVLTDPQAARELAADYERAKEQTTALRNQAAKWQLTLNDGIADLIADFDHRLRGRLRATSAQADAILDEQEPAAIWDEFTEWLKRRVSRDLTRTYVELSRRTDDLSAEVARHFADGRAALEIRLDGGEALSKAAAVGTRNDVEADPMGFGGAAMIALRGSYGGLLMFGMVAQLAGMAMLNPATVVIGALMGRKAIKDEGRRRLAAQRQQAKITSRQFVDESMAAAQAAVNANNQEREKRFRDVTAELARLDHLRAQVDALAEKSHD
ncbi:MAG: hypothetical protein CSB46_02845 [Micrococcales bacterium]|nr:MAG: hypothetical protein CSB46_02845 [Micrococcales bacterium]